MLRIKFLSVFLVFFLVTASNVFCSYETDQVKNKLSEKLAILLSKKNSLKYLGIGTGDYFDIDKTEIWGINFASQERLNLDQGRELVKNLTQEIWDYFNVKREYAIHRADEYSNKFSDSPYIIPSLVGFKISFWDESIDRILPPHIAEIKVYEGHVYYYFADPETQYLKEPIVETFEQAGIVLKSYSTSSEPKARQF
jgi:hypothetical protein